LLLLLIKPESSCCCFQSDGDISMLPTVVLPQILQKLEPAAVLQSYALTSRAWNDAAALSISSISIKDCKQVKADAVSQWLQKHGPNTISNSLAIESFSQQLATVQPAAAAADAASQVPAAPAAQERQCQHARC
jgi:hypothetical protein